MLGYWGELAERGGLDVVRELGLAGAGGDLFCDGAFGSHTAALQRRPTPTGRTPPARCASRPASAGRTTCAPARVAGIQAGFHCIGDAAVAQVLDAVGTVVDELGRAAVRACRHRLEHVEMVDDADIDRMRDLGHGRQRPAGLRRRLGRGRRHVRRAAGRRAGRWRPTRSPTSPTPGSPWRSAATPRSPRWTRGAACTPPSTTAPPGSGLRPFDAFDAATHGGWHAVRAEHPAGPLAVGAPAAPRAVGDRPDPVRRPVASGRGPTCRAAARRRRPDRRLRMTHAWRPRPGAWWPGPGSWPPWPRSRSIDLAHRHTTVSVERAVLRLAGLTGTDPVTGEGRPEDRVPWVNRVVDAVRDQVGPGAGVALPVWHALASGDGADLQALAEQVGAGTARFDAPDRRGRRPRPGGGPRRRRRRASPASTPTARRREELVATHGDPPRRPWIYLIVATGDIHEDIPQAQAAARAGADVIAVIRSTGQSLLDYVPEGATRTGYAGTYATQENFRLMRAALDDVSAELGRYVRLTNYASGPVHARDRRPGRARAAGHDAQRRDVRDPLPRHQPAAHLRRPAVQPDGARPRRDHHQHRRGQLPHHRRRRRRGAHRHGQPAAQRDAGQGGRPRGLAARPRARLRDRARSGEESFRLELAHALLARELFPDAPLKWMPPTKHMTGDVFRGYLLDGFFNLAGALTGQGILLVGMMTEAVVTPWLSDRDLALRNVRYVLNAAGNLAEDFAPPPGGFIDRRARHRAARGGRPARRGSPTTREGLIQAIADGTFGITKRPTDGGKGLDGVVRARRGRLQPGPGAAGRRGPCRDRPGRPRA